MKVSELKKILHKDGWYIDHHGKEHDAYVHDIKPGILRIPRHDSKELKTGTLQGLLKDAGLK